MARRKAVPTLRTRREGEKVKLPTMTDLPDPATFAERLKSLNREGVTELPNAREP